MNTTCQICGREIKAASGLIAHHGYQRPGEGWQTASCFGARYRPYEVACDALPPAIRDCQRFIASQEEALAKWLVEPPAEIRHQRRDSRYRPVDTEKMFARPEQFDGATAVDNYRSDTYVWHYVRTRTAYGRRIRNSRETLRYLEERLNNWRAK